VCEPWRRLTGWQKIELDPGEKPVGKIKLEPLAMSIWSETARNWEWPAGTYRVQAGNSSADLPLQATFVVK
jgi:beta-glucosidase